MSNYVLDLRKYLHDLPFIRKVKEQLRPSEGLRLLAYWDPIGLCWTVGYGHTGKEVVRGMRITLHDAEYFLEQDVIEAIGDAERLFPSFKFLDSEPRKAVLADMSFNMGYNRLSKFRRLREGVATYNWELAAQSMEQSLWAKQVKGRAVKLTKQMRTGKYVKHG